MGVWLKPTFHATPLPLCHETSVCTLEVSALIRGSLPRPWGEGGRRPGEGVNLLVMFQHLSLLPGTQHQHRQPVEALPVFRRDRFPQSGRSIGVLVYEEIDLLRERPEASVC